MAADASKPDPAHSLVLAIIAASTAPLVLLDAELKVVAASRSFFRVFAIEAAGAASRRFFDLGEGEWDKPQLRALLNATVSEKAEIDAYEFDLARDGQGTRRLVLNAHKLDYDDSESARVLLSITDTTDAKVAERLKDDLIREKAVLLQEVQHRVANSLQIIAAVLLQSARRVSSTETRAHLEEAHQRVMSVAEVQRHLAATHGEDVHLRPYFTTLCESLGASMIRDHNALVLEVKADESTAAADVSVSLGLIVTELVINALKHAFPDSRIGRITVGYQGRGPNWTLSVADNGIGMPSGTDAPKAGLGTSIVEALSRQLHAHVQVSDNHPGTKVSIVHAQIAVVEDEDVEEFGGPAV
ncbi:MAG TPA: sensor histidine kinase [Caulobacteraceae bacterium]|nr:sensor histidine kinase [Caulobacteraceae bacterium]